MLNYQGPVFAVNSSCIPKCGAILTLKHFSEACCALVRPPKSLCCCCHVLGINIHFSPAATRGHFEHMQSKRGADVICAHVSFCLLVEVVQKSKWHISCVPFGSGESKKKKEKRNHTPVHHPQWPSGLSYRKGKDCVTSAGCCRKGNSSDAGAASCTLCYFCCAVPPKKEVQFQTYSKLLAWRRARLVSSAPQKKKKKNTRKLTFSTHTHTHKDE